MINQTIAECFDCGVHNGWTSVILVLLGIFATIMGILITIQFIREIYKNRKNKENEK